MPVVSLSSKGQIVIPRQIRDELGLEQGTQLEIRIEGDAVSLTRLDQVVPASDWKSLRGLLQGTTALEDHLREHEEETRR